MAYGNCRYLHATIAPNFNPNVETLTIFHFRLDCQIFLLNFGTPSLWKLLVKGWIICCLNKAIRAKSSTTFSHMCICVDLGKVLSNQIVLRMMSTSPIMDHEHIVFHYNFFFFRRKKPDLVIQ